jgi:hypothetical protein
MKIWARHIAHMGRMKNVYRILVRLPKGDRLFVRRRNKWEDNIEIDPNQIGV